MSVGERPPFEPPTVTPLGNVRDLLAETCSGAVFSAIGDKHAKGDQNPCTPTPRELAPAESAEKPASLQGLELNQHALGYEPEPVTVRPCRGNEGSRRGKLLMISVFYRGRLRTAFVRTESHPRLSETFYGAVFDRLAPEYLDGTTWSYG